MWVACDLTTSLRRAVSATTATTVLPRRAYSGPSMTAGQSVMGMQITADSAPLSLPGWHESDRRLFKRAPFSIGEWASLIAKHGANECTAENGSPLLDKPPPRKSIFDIHGTHDPKGTISQEEAAKPIATFEELEGMRKEAEGDKTKKNTLAFHVSRHHLPRLRSGS